MSCMNQAFVAKSRHGSGALQGHFSDFLSALGAILMAAPAAKAT